MDGWLEWIIFTGMMVIGGVAVLAFFTNPLLTLLVLAAAALAWWTVGPRTPPMGLARRQSPGAEAEVRTRKVS